MRHPKIITALALALVAAASVPAAAQSPIVNPVALRFEHDESGGLSTATQYEVGYFLSATATNPVQRDAVAASVATVVTGQTKQLTFAALPAYPVGVAYYSRIQAINGTGSSGWSAAATATGGGPAVSFGKPGQPRVPASPVLVPATP